MIAGYYCLAFHTDSTLLGPLHSFPPFTVQRHSASLQGRADAIIPTWRSISCRRTDRMACPALLPPQAAGRRKVCIRAKRSICCSTPDVPTRSGTELIIRVVADCSGQTELSVRQWGHKFSFVFSGSSYHSLGPKNTN